MRKVILTLLTLFAFASAAVAECVDTSKTVPGNSSKGTSKSITLDCSCSTLKFTPSYNFSVKTTKGTVKVIEYNQAGTELKTTSYSDVKKSGSERTITLQSGTKTIAFQNANSVGSYTLTISNIKLTKIASFESSGEDYEFGDVSVNTKSTKNALITLTYSGNDGAISVTSNNSVFVPSVTSISSCSNGTTTVNVTATPTAIGSTSGTITVKLGSTVKKTITVSINGTLSAPATFEKVGDNYNSIKVRWSAVSGATGYKVTCTGKTAVDQASGSFSQEGGYYVYTWTGLSMEKDYTCSVFSKSGSSYSSEKSSVFHTKDMAQTTLTVTPSFNLTDISWTSVADATSYKLTSTTGLSKTFSSTDALSYRETGLTPGQSYTYKVYVYHNSEESKTVKSQTVNAKLSNCAAESLNDVDFDFWTTGGENIERTFSKNEPTISFNYNVDGGVSTKFRLQEYVNGNYVTKWEKSNNSGSANVKLSREARKVRFYHSGTMGGEITNISVTQGSYLEVADEVDFQNVEMNTNGNATANVNFSLLGGDVYISENSTDFAVTENAVGSTVDCAYGTTTLHLTFKASSVIGQHTGKMIVGDKEVTLKANVTLPIPTNLTASTQYTSATLSWSGSASKYYIYKDGSKIGESTSTSYQITGLQWGTQYGKYTVASVSGSSVSDPSNECSFTTPSISVPSGLNLTGVSYQEGTLNWGAVKDATSYNVFKDGVQVATGVTATSYTFTGLLQNTSYQVTVQAVYNSKATASATAVTLHTASLAVPTPTLKNKTYSTIEICWNNIADAKGGYDLIIDGNTEDIKALAAGTTSYLYEHLLLHSTHTFQIYSKLADGTRSLSANSVEITTNDLAAPATATAGTASYASVPVSWSKVTDATGYCVKNNTTGEQAIVDGGDVLNYTVSGLDMATAYSFSVYGMYNGAISNNSRATGSVTTKQMDITIVDCEIFNDPTKYTRCMGVSADYIDYDLSSLGIYHTAKVKFEASKATLGIIGNPDLVMYVYANGAWTSTLWSSHTADGFSDDFKEYTVSIPFGTTKIRFDCNNVANGTLNRYVQKLRVYMGAEAAPSSTTLNFDAYIGEEVTESFTLKYGNRANLKYDIDNDHFTSNVPNLASCTEGETTLDVKFKTTTLDNQQGTFTIANGDVATVSLIANVKKLPAPTNFQAIPMGKSSIALSWNTVDLATGYKLTCEQTSLSETLSADVTQFGVQELDENKSYTFHITTLYNDIENESAEVSMNTYSSVTLAADGPFAETTTVTITGEAGKWIESDKSFKYGSKATINASNSDACAEFEKLTVGSDTYYTLPKEITVTDPVTATVYYKAKALAAPVVTATSDSKSKAQISWGAVSCADNYNVYMNGVLVESGVEATSYNFTDLAEGTTYTFSVEAASTLAGTTMSEEASATTYSTITVNYHGSEAPVEQSSTITLTSGNKNAEESSYSVGSVVSIQSSIDSELYDFEKMVINGAETTNNPAEFTIAQTNTVDIYYKKNGKIKVGDKVYDTLEEAIKHSTEGEIKLLKDVDDQDFIVDRRVEFNGNGKKVGNLIIKSNGDVHLTGDVIVVNNFGLEISATHSGEYEVENGVLQINGSAYIDKTLDPSGKGSANKWYALTVPFPVSVKDGVYKVVNGEAVKLTNATGYLFMEYDGDKRASGKNGWITVGENATLVPGKFYMIGTDGSNVYRFYKTSASDLVTADKSLTLEEFESTNPKNANWNGVGNSQLYNVGVNNGATLGQVYLNGESRYLAVELANNALAVSTPLFIQQAGGTVNLARKDDGTLRSADAENQLYKVVFTKSGEQSADQMFVSLATEMENSYKMGVDLMKFSVVSSAPQVYTKAYNMDLCAYQAPIVEKEADVALYLVAPKAGRYTLSIAANGDAEILLFEDGMPIHNFSEDGDYELSLAKGTTDNYSLRFVTGDDFATFTTDADGSGAIIYVTEGNLVIKGMNAGDEVAVGNMVHTLYAGTSDGEDLVLPLYQQGAYWVSINGKTVKVLNTK